MATLTTFLSENKNKIIMKLDFIDVNSVMASVIELGGLIMYEMPAEAEEFVEVDKQEVSHSMIEEFQVLVPLENNGTDQKGSEVISIQEIDLKKSHGTRLSCGKEQYVILHPDLYKNLILLKLYSENLCIVKP